MRVGVVLPARTVIAGMLVWLATCMVAIPAPASAAWPGRNGAIVFTVMSGCDDPRCGGPTAGALQNGLWRIDPVTRTMRHLIADEQELVVNPAFAPDGRRLLLGTSKGFLLTDVDVRSRSYDQALRAADHRWLADGNVGFSRLRATPAPANALGCELVSNPALQVTTQTESAPLSTRTRHAYAPAFSARGRLMAYHGYDAFTVLSPPSGFGPPCQASHVDAIWVQRVDVPASGRRVFVDRTPGLYRRSVAPDFSPDGRKLAVVTSRGVVVVDLDRERTRRLKGTGYAKGVAWSPDGRWLAITIAAHHPARTRLVLIPARGGPRRTLGSWAVGPTCRDCGLGDITWQTLPRRRTM